MSDDGMELRGEVVKVKGGIFVKGMVVDVGGGVGGWLGLGRGEGEEWEEVDDFVRGGLVVGKVGGDRVRGGGVGFVVVIGDFGGGFGVVGLEVFRVWDCGGWGC